MSERDTAEDREKESILTEEEKGKLIEDAMMVFGLTRKQYDILHMAMMAKRKNLPPSLMGAIAKAFRSADFAFGDVPFTIADWVADREVKDD